jgi:hypothetical protein
MKKKSNADGKPMCCAPGDLSGCMIETTEELKETQLEANLPAGSRVTDDTKNRGKAQPVAADENNLQERE